MWSFPKHIRDRRSEPRLDLRLPCILGIDDRPYDALLTVLSYGGAGLLARESLGSVMPSQIQWLSFANLGHLPVSLRWRTGNRVGVTFTNKNAVRPRLTAFFRSRNFNVDVRRV